MKKNNLLIFCFTSFSNEFHRYFICYYRRYPLQRDRGGCLSFPAAFSSSCREFSYGIYPPRIRQPLHLLFPPYISQSTLTDLFPSCINPLSWFFHRSFPVADYSTPTDLFSPCMKSVSRVFSTYIRYLSQVLSHLLLVHSYGSRLCVHDASYTNLFSSSISSLVQVFQLRIGIPPSSYSCCSIPNLDVAVNSVTSVEVKRNCGLS